MRIRKFWQARYRAVRLLDETAILACAAYVDLNPIRAALAETIETSDFTSAQKRAQDMQSQVVNVTPGKRRSNHLAPVELRKTSDTTPASRDHSRPRCSDRGFLPMSTAAYLGLLDWTARQQRAGKRGSTPHNVASIFDRLGISADVWCRLVKDFGRLFSLVAGQPDQIDAHRSKHGSHRYRTRQDARDLMASA